jgi:dTDP-4-amino-4,6-dideoxygalactose transaminase
LLNFTVFFFVDVELDKNLSLLEQHVKENETLAVVEVHLFGRLYNFVVDK